MKNFKFHILSFITCFLFITLDQITKHIAYIKLGNGQQIKIIPGILHLTYLENRGAAWGVLQGGFVIFTIITIVVSVMIVFTYLRIYQRAGYRFFTFTLLLLEAGALGNFIDRLMNRYVIDFINVTIIDFPIFNLADIYVTISAVMLFYCILIRHKDDEILWTKKKSK